MPLSHTQLLSVVDKCQQTEWFPKPLNPLSAFFPVFQRWCPPPPNSGLPPRRTMRQLGTHTRRTTQQQVCFSMQGDLGGYVV